MQRCRVKATLCYRACEAIFNVSLLVVTCCEFLKMVQERLGCCRDHNALKILLQAILHKFFFLYNVV